MSKSVKNLLVTLSFNFKQTIEKDLLCNYAVNAQCLLSCSLFYKIYILPYLPLAYFVLINIFFAAISISEHVTQKKHSNKSVNQRQLLTQFHMYVRGKQPFNENSALSSKAKKPINPVECSFPKLFIINCSLKTAH